ncbi:MAG: phage tail protein [Rhodanobacteraceae bacterium]|jgi:microcystin-dependent protein|nr:phage tail protein [Rhodanobacteraceae bacterium]
MEPFIGEIRMAGFNFAPVDWAFCNGALLSIAQNDALFSLIGTIYGGDGQATFGLPNLCGRIPVHQGQATTGTTYQLGQVAGSESVTLNTTQLPAHSHAVYAASGGARTAAAADNVLASGEADVYTRDTASPQAMAAASVGSASGGGRPHSNLQPFLAVNFIIAMGGIYPSRS